MCCREDQCSIKLLEGYCPLRLGETHIQSALVWTQPKKLLQEKLFSNINRTCGLKSALILFSCPDPICPTLKSIVRVMCALQEEVWQLKGCFPMQYTCLCPIRIYCIMAALYLHKWSSFSIQRLQNNQPVGFFACSYCQQLKPTAVIIAFCQVGRFSAGRTQ